MDTTLVVKVLEAVWTTKPQTAWRVRGRIELILDWAKARGHREGENPARWRGHLDHLLPHPSRVARVKHHASLPSAEIPEFMRGLRGHEGIVARALEFTVLTAARLGEVLGAHWSEIAGEVWTVPATRMKGGREHRVPLSDPAVQLLEALPRTSEPHFSGGALGRPNTEQRYLEVPSPDGTPRHYRAWFSVLISRLGGRNNGSSEPCSRNGASACRR